MHLSSTLRSTVRRISPGGRITIVLALVWSAGVAMHLSRGAFGRIGEPVALYLTYPLADLNPIGGIINRRGVMELDFFLSTCAMTVPNLFILGYTTAACWKLVKWLVMWPFRRRDSRSTNSIASKRGS